MDLNGDGRADLVLGGWPGGTGTNNEILLNNGSGTFVRTGAPVLPPKLFGAGGTVVGIKAADFNGDGRTDLLMSTTDHYLHAALQLLLRQSNGTFTDATAQMGISWDPSVGEIDRSTAVLDLNGDGKPDIVAHFYHAADFSFHARLFLNRGDATFIEATSVLPSGPVGLSFHTADVDGDGLVDFVSTSAPWVNFLHALKPISLLYFYDAPAITTQPVTQVVTVGSSVTFTAAASGYPAPTYQWRKNGLDILGATGSAYTNSSVNFTDAGSYTVVVSTAAGNVTSSAATLTVNDSFNHWRQSSFTAPELADPAKSGPNAIYGRDGLANLVKYALGLDPKVNATTGTPEVTTTANDWVYTYTRPSNRPDLTYTVEVSTDLATWTFNGVTHEPVSLVNDIETWRGRYSRGLASKIFFHLKIIH